MVVLRLKRMIPMILLYLMTMLTKLICILAVFFLYEVGFTEVTSQNNSQKIFQYKKPSHEKMKKIDLESLFKKWQKSHFRLKFGFSKK